MIHIGFTGTHLGMTEAQKKSFTSFMMQRNNLPDPSDPSVIFHQGDCIGADDEARVIAINVGFRVESHPPDNPKARAYGPADFTHEPKPYLERDQDIVNASSVLLAAPSGKKEQVRSGTWYTVRRARDKGIPITFFYPDGTIGEEP